VFSLRLYIILDKSLIGRKSEVHLASRVIEGGATAIQLRDKFSDDQRLIKIGTKLREITRKNKVGFIINDRVDIALAVDADGVHLGQEDLPLKFARRLIGKRIIGISTHSLVQAKRAEKEGADYISVGPIFRTSSKPELVPVGTAIISRIKKEVNLPLVAIGGIKLDNIKKVIARNPEGIAIASAVLKSKKIENSTLKIANLLNAKSAKGTHRS